MPGVILRPGEANTASQLRRDVSLLSLPGSLANSANLALPSFSRSGSLRQATQPDLEQGQERGGDTPEPPVPPVSQAALVRPDRVKAPRPISVAPQLTLPQGWGLRVWNSAQKGRPKMLSVYIILY
jgi:hypothetical protein